MKKTEEDLDLGIKCPVILSAFRAGNENSSTVLFDFSIINLFDEFRQPIVPYIRKEIDYTKLKMMTQRLNENIDEIDLSILTNFGQFLWNYLIPREIGVYLSYLEE